MQKYIFSKVLISDTHPSSWDIMLTNQTRVPLSDLSISCSGPIRRGGEGDLNCLLSPFYKPTDNNFKIKINMLKHSNKLYRKCVIISLMYGTNC